ncbi:serine/threonine-protein phosphatase 4 regulatory subunit 1 isoform X2 [Chanos chanos]|uniref:Serine/threonine-protein phosphatase 4 regulatory subunit 1 isoform X2 n=1 Tax=Chanos chanos TaxID=29144 RepID=A0A6J2VVE2_CHACN|nr:serine/threonine-protein phosphatase 4 regulatory subunit 1-like isoform X2 [Chanos chanos]
MEGLSLYFEDSHDDLDDIGFDDYGSECDGIRITAFLDAGQDNLTPLGRLEKYAFSENVFNRQIVARGLLDVLREFSDNENDFISVMETIGRMSEDGEPTVRAELMEQVPNIAMFLHESRPNFPDAFSGYLLPIVVRYLTDPNNQVRKTSQAALLVLLEQELICKTDIEEKVCPVLVELTEPCSDDDYKIEAVAIMCKLVNMLSKDTVEDLLLPRFCELCSDVRLFQVRKVCAANFGEFCSIVGQEATEKLLMPKFFALCSDSLWGIRKACAECFMIVSNCTSPEVRRTKLSPLFISLISDQSRWVRQAAFQSLGRFISTFANPSSTGLHFREDGISREVSQSLSESNELQMTPARCEASDNANEKQIQPDTSSTPPSESQTAPPSSSSSSLSTSASPSPVPAADRRQDSSGPVAVVSAGPVVSAQPSSALVLTESSGCENVAQGPSEAEPDSFTSFLYWRPPLPDITQDLLQLLHSDSGPEEQGVPSLDVEGPSTSSQIQKVLDCLQPHLDDPDVQAQVQVLSAALKAAQLESQSEDIEQEEMTTETRHSDLPQTLVLNPADEQTNPETQLPEYQGSPPTSPLLMDHSQSSGLDLIESVEEEKDCEDEKRKVQDVIPQPLLDQYLSMTDPARAQTVDTEIAKHCAFSLPGVALTLGRQNWHCLKDTYETLATDVQWKVRRTLAFSIHELAVILGDQLTAADLVPIFNGFLKDLDEVRIGVLKHLYDFLKLLHAEKRREYLYQLQEFMVTDNSRNWRFRYELAEQLILIIELYSHSDVYDYLRQIALNLCSDKVSEVRWISYKLVVEILQKLYACGAHDLGLNFINELIIRFCHCPKWVGRQAFAFICQAIVEEDSMPMAQFAQHLLPSLLSLSSDPVPNVRVLVAKALRQSIVEKPYFKDPGSAYSDELEEAIMELQTDKDRDVRFFASQDPNKNVMNTVALI